MTATDTADGQVNLPAVPDAERSGTRLPDVIGPASPSEFAAMMEQAKQIASTTFVPEAFRGDEGAVLAAFMKARELRIGPMYALEQLFPSPDGKVGMQAQLMVALARREGHHFEVLEWNDQACEVKGVRGDNGDHQIVRWTLEDALQAGLISGIEDGRPVALSKYGKAKPWQLYPRNLLWSRCVSQLSRMLWPDAIGGTAYTAEELGEEWIDEEGRPIKADPVDRVRDALRRRWDTAYAEMDEPSAATVDEAVMKGGLTNEAWARWDVAKLERWVMRAEKLAADHPFGKTVDVTPATEQPAEPSADSAPPASQPERAPTETETDAALPEAACGVGSSCMRKDGHEGACDPPDVPEAADDLAPAADPDTAEADPEPDEAPWQVEALATLLDCTAATLMDDRTKRPRRKTVEAARNAELRTDLTNIGVAAGLQSRGAKVLFDVDKIGDLAQMEVDRIRSAIRTDDGGYDTDVTVPLSKLWADAASEATR